MTDEHIVPFALGGRIILPNASCAKCAEVTKSITGMIARSIYGNLRVRLGIQSRRKSKRPSAFPMTIDRPDGTQREIMVPANIWPRVYPVLVLKQASIVSGLEPDTYEVEIRGEHSDVDVLYSRGLVSREEKVSFTSIMQARMFCRQLAQIAHAICVAELGFEDYQPLLIPLIFDNDTPSQVPFSLIGSVSPENQLNSQIALDAINIRGVYYISCRFAMPNLGWKFPTYQILSGLIPDDASVERIRSKTAFAHNV